MAPRYESRLHQAADAVVVIFQTLFRVASAQPLTCASCGRATDYMTARQKDQRTSGESITCGRLLFGRRPCKGLMTVADTPGEGPR